MSVVLAAAGLGLFAPALGGEGLPSPESKISAWLAERLAPGRSEPFVVLFDSSQSLHRALASARGAAAPAQAVYDVLRNRARRMQNATRRWLDEAGIRYRPLYIVNGLALEGDRSLALALAARPEVARIVGDPKVRGIAPEAARSAGADAGPEWGILAIRADRVWNEDGRRGEGIVVASADTGVEWTHPALRDRYRGWDGQTVTHDFNWHDAIEDRAEPLDDHDHGTHTTGTMVGDDGQGNQIGVAPAARWIACRNMDHGVGRPSTYLACNQFFLAPYPHGGDPERDGDPAKAPHIVNNSWGCPPSEGCDEDTLRDSFAALRAAGILSVAAAGNSGPFCATVSDPPAIHEEAFVAGATDSSNALALFSSRGPVLADGSGRLKPDVAAPGVNVRSSVRGGGYASFSGTSMASPHTAGAAALLWSARPQLEGLIRISRCLVSRSANPFVNPLWNQTCGGTDRMDRPNNLFGWGLVDAYGAVHLGPDTDSDGVADACDCAPSDGGAYDPPGEVGGLGFGADRVTIFWMPQAREAGPGTIYDLLRGDLDDLRSTGAIGSASCLAAGLSAPSFADSDEPGADRGYYYLVQGRNGCGSGGWGETSGGAPRSHPDCP